MTHKPIHIQNLELSFPHKTCFDNFNTQIYYGNRIAIIGRNGSGKSHLLQCIAGLTQATSGHIKHDTDVTFGFVPQIIENHDILSGAERFHQALTSALKQQPNVLLLDEPTNHLDRRNKQQLLRMLQSYAGTLIMVSHDTELLRNTVDCLWHIEHGEITQFHGAYDDYVREIAQQRESIEREVARLKAQKHQLHDALMKEQARAAKSKAKGEKSIQQHKWPTIVSAAKVNRAKETTGRNKANIDDKKQLLSEKLSQLYLTDIITPNFSIDAAKTCDYTLISITDGAIAYSNNLALLQHIHFSMSSKARVALLGDNASGKSSFIKAILTDSRIVSRGHWLVPKPEDIGYLDQHYANLNPEKTVFEMISELKPSWSSLEIRQHLNQFLFRKNEEVETYVKNLSGGEKVRLSLALIAADTPIMLILDEITNNLDLESKHHVTQVLKAYPGALLIISHDADFLESFDIDSTYQIEQGTLSLLNVRGS